MKSHLIKIIAVTISLAIALQIPACNDDEKLIDNTKETWKMLVSRDSGNPRIEFLEFPSGKLISQDIISGNNDFTLTANPTKIKIYRSMLYLLIPSEYRILIFTLSNFKLAFEIDFSAENLEPTDICFLPNGTTAYVCHKNASLVTILDIYYFKKAKQIIVGKNPTAIACAGNQIYVANYGNNSISVIDSRTNEVEAEIKLSPKPAFLDFDVTGKVAVVVSIGQGKDEQIIEKSPAVATFINVETRQIENSIELGYQANKSIEQIPTALSISETNWAFVTTNELLFRIDLRRKDRIIFVNRFKYFGTLYNYYKKEIWLIRDDGNEYSLIISNQTTGAVIQRFNLGQDIYAIQPL